jgi:hypothetical protein
MGAIGCEHFGIGGPTRTEADTMTLRVTRAIKALVLALSDCCCWAHLRGKTCRLHGRQITARNCSNDGRRCVYRVFGLLHFRKREINWPVLAGRCKPVETETNAGGVAIRSLLDYPADDHLGLAICPSFAQCIDDLLKVARLPGTGSCGGKDRPTDEM